VSLEERYERAERVLVGLAQWRHERLAGAADSHDLAAEQGRVDADLELVGASASICASSAIPVQLPRD
jgi:hypothetical protein